MDYIQQAIGEVNPDLVIIDSIQTVYQSEVTSAPGSVSQVRECTATLMRIAKTKGIAIFIVGHVTKEGAIAGPDYLSIWWIQCCTLKENGIIHIGLFEP